MCWLLYAAADRPLDLRPFDPNSPGFNVTEPSEWEHSVRAQFSKPFVYVLGSHTSCGCGFDRGQANEDVPDELLATEASLSALHACLADAVASSGPLELYACWNGDEGSAPDHRWNLRLADFRPDMDWFPDRTFIEVTP